MAKHKQPKYHRRVLALTLTLMVVAFSLVIDGLMNPAIGKGFTLEELKALAARESTLSEQDRQSVSDAWSRADSQRAMAQQQQQRALQQLKQQQPNNLAAQPPQVIVFASLGMPRASLHQLLVQADRYQVPVVIRGVLPGGFKSTVQAIHLAMANKDQIPVGKNQPQRGGMAIDPNWFRTFGIQQVPAFVTVKDGACLSPDACSATDFDVLYGNVPLRSALEMLVSDGSVVEPAKAVLARGGQS